MGTVAGEEVLDGFYLLYESRKQSNKLHWQTMHALIINSLTHAFPKGPLVLGSLV